MTVEVIHLLVRVDSPAPIQPNESKSELERVHFASNFAQADANLQ